MYKSVYVCMRRRVYIVYTYKVHITRADGIGEEIREACECAKKT